MKIIFAAEILASVVPVCFGMGGTRQPITVAGVFKCSQSQQDPTKVRVVEIWETELRTYGEPRPSDGYIYLHTEMQAWYIVSYYMKVYHTCSSNGQQLCHRINIPWTYINKKPFSVDGYDLFDKKGC